MDSPRPDKFLLAEGEVSPLLDQIKELQEKHQGQESASRLLKSGSTWHQLYFTLVALYTAWMEGPHKDMQIDRQTYRETIALISHAPSELSMPTFWILRFLFEINVFVHTPWIPEVAVFDDLVPMDYFDPLGSFPSWLSTGWDAGRTGEQGTIGRPYLSRSERGGVLSPKLDHRLGCGLKHFLLNVSTVECLISQAGNNKYMFLFDRACELGGCVSTCFPRFYQLLTNQ